MFFFLPLILLVVLITNESGSGDTSVMAGVFFSPPFEDGVSFTINSQYLFKDVLFIHIVTGVGMNLRKTSSPASLLKQVPYGGLHGKASR